MTTIYLKNSQEPVLEQDIDDLELMISAQLPLDFKQFLQVNNGGRTLSVLSFPIYNNPNGDEGRTHTFYYLKHNYSYKDTNDIRNKLLVFKDRIPRYFVPFATDPGGNQLCISVRKQDYNTIYFWAHDEEEDLEGDDGTAIIYAGIYLVATNFNDFLYRLKTIPLRK